MKLSLQITAPLVLLLCISCTTRPSPTDGGANLIRITCAPRFVYHSAKGTHLNGLTEDELIPLREWLVLDDGSRKYKLKWPTPGLSPGSLMTSNVYTFVLRKQGSQYIIEKPVRRHE